MLTLGRLELGPAPRIAVPFSDREGPEAIAAAIARGADIAELRVDLFSSSIPNVCRDRTKQFREIATLGTPRSASEGGRWQGSEADRLRVFEALTASADGVDVELASEICADVLAMAAERGCLSIASHHDFAGTPAPARLIEIADAGREAGADVVKIATTAGDAGDLRALAAVCVARPATPLIVIGMGRFGVASRLLLPALGSLVTFASLDAASATAPGQLPLEQTRAWLDRLYPGEDEPPA